MNGIQLMIDEHKYIKRMLKVIRAACVDVLNNKVDYMLFRDCIDFVRNFADKHHHGKEEEFLFQIMTEELGKDLVEAPLSGMYAEHDLGRLYIRNLETALKKHEDGDDEARLDIIANAICYTDLLHRHIDKEDNALFMFAEKQLKPETLEKFHEMVEEYEKRETSQEAILKYTNMVKDFERKLGLK